MKVKVQFKIFILAAIGIFQASALVSKEETIEAIDKFIELNGYEDNRPLLLALRKRIVGWDENSVACLAEEMKPLALIYNSLDSYKKGPEFDAVVKASQWVDGRFEKCNEIFENRYKDKIEPPKFLGTVAREFADNRESNFWYSFVRSYFEPKTLKSYRFIEKSKDKDKLSKLVSENILKPCETYDDFDEASLDYIRLVDEWRQRKSGPLFSDLVKSVDLCRMAKTMGLDNIRKMVYKGYRDAARRAKASYSSGSSDPGVGLPWWFWFG